MGRNTMKALEIALMMTDEDAVIHAYLDQRADFYDAIVENDPTQESSSMDGKIDCAACAKRWAEMLALIPLPYRILGALLLAMSLFAGGVWHGTSTTNDRRDAKELIAERAAAKKYGEEVDRGNALSAQLATAESTIQIKTIERIKYVPQVTTGQPCLGPAAVDLINGVRDMPNGTTTGGGAGESTPESSRTLTASDADIAAWAVEAHQYYDTCAARLNTLIDFENGRAP